MALRFEDGRPTAVDAIARLLADETDISELLLFEPSPMVPAQDRIAANDHTEALLDAGLELRRETGLPFWEALLLSSFETGEPAFPILQEARFHNQPPVRSSAIPRDAWCQESVDRFMDNRGGDSICVLSSRVRMSSGQHRHIPMLDFHSPSNRENEALARRVVEHLWLKGGFLLESGKSYHFYGKGLLYKNELAKFLGRALLFSPIVDRAWIAHQLIEGACGLRITAKPDGYFIPRVVAEL